MDNFNKTQSQPFFNTIEYNAAEWEKANDAAIKMQKQIEGIYRANPGAQITAYMIQDYLEAKLGKRQNINSVRRCISNLKNEDVVDMLKTTRIGKEGVPEHFYVLRGTGPEGVHIYRKGEKSTGDLAIEMLSNSNLAK